MANKNQMRGVGTSRGHAHFQSRSGEKTLRSCKKKKEKADSVVLIDVDSDNFHNVIILDVPDSLQQKLRNKKVPQHSVITIDDDDDDDDDNCNDDLVSDATSSRKTNNVDSFGNESEFVRERKTPFKFSNGKRIYTGNRYGLFPEDSFESDCSECELMEGRDGTVREQWERAFMKRKSCDNTWNHQSSLDSETSGSSSHSAELNPNIEVGKPVEQNFADPLSSSSNNPECEFPSSSFAATGNKDLGGTFVDHEKTRNFSDFDGKVDLESSSWWTFKPVETTQPFDEENSSSKIECPQVKQDKVFSVEKDEELLEEPLICRTQKLNESTCVRPGFKEEEKLVSEELNSEINKESDEFQVEEKRISGELFSSFNTKQTETDIREGNPCLMEGKKLFSEALSNTQPEHRTGSSTCAIQSDAIFYREKYKETDEYKQAQMEEMAARQRQIQIQAEEAQRLRKRKQAENMRLLDMERRQKQRIDEMRETQKKDEENMNLKEKFRVEVMKELGKLEMICSNMASLLRGLGIKIGGGPFPSSDEVHAAYKRALLKFHPDRASRSDIRQQVEAEEKFKLISRMKERLLLT